MKSTFTKTLLALGLAAGVAIPCSAGAAAYSQSPSPIPRAVGWAVVTLAVVVYAVLTGILVFFFRVARNEAKQGETHPPASTSFDL